MFSSISEKVFIALIGAAVSIATLVIPPLFEAAKLNVSPEKLAIAQQAAEIWKRNQQCLVGTTPQTIKLPYGAYRFYQCPTRDLFVFSLETNKGAWVDSKEITAFNLIPPASAQQLPVANAGKVICQKQEGNQSIIVTQLPDGKCETVRIDVYTGQVTRSVGTCNCYSS